MLKNLFIKRKSIEQISFPEADVALKLMFEMAMIDGSLDKAELELIKKRVIEIAPEDAAISAIIKKMIDQSLESVSLYPTVKKVNDAYENEEKEGFKVEVNRPNKKKAAPTSSGKKNNRANKFGKGYQEKEIDDEIIEEDIITDRDKDNNYLGNDIQTSLGHQAGITVS